jgi:hypothetical protein
MRKLARPKCTAKIHRGEAPCLEDGAWNLRKTMRWVHDWVQLTGKNGSKFFGKRLTARVRSEDLPHSAFEDSPFRVPLDRYPRCLL